MVGRRNLRSLRALRLSSGAVQNATTTYPWTHTFRHLIPLSARTLKETSRIMGDSPPKVADAKDCIKWWNIVPGDQVRIRGAPGDTLHTVKAINKFTNRVFMHAREASEDSTGQSEGENVHYSKCQLYIGDYEFPPAPGSIEPSTRRVFARRIGTSSPSWNTFFKRIHWNRYAVATDPRVPQLKKPRVLIPWPKFAKPALPAAEPMDTPKDEVARVTWRPPPFPRFKGAPIPQPPSEKSFLSQIVNGIRSPIQPPAEIFLEKELTNPHGFAKKHERWVTYQAYKQTLLTEFIQREQKELNGRTNASARADATFKWKMRLEQERKEKFELRKTFQKLKQERKSHRKVRKEHKRRERLANMVLVEADNQFIPPSVAAAAAAAKLHA